MNIVFKVSDNIKEKMIDYYKDKQREKKPPYSIFQAQEADTIITLYESGKVMFQGISADIDANMWADLESHFNNIKVDTRDASEKKKEKESKKDYSHYNINAIGSDEVGTGDYLLPIVVCASYVKKEDIMFLQELGVTDSKKLTDDKIKRIAPMIIKKIPYEALIISNKDYNKYVKLGYNMNKIKAILHNKVLYKMTKKGLQYNEIIVDQFCFPKNYYSYIKDSTEKVNNITFLTKAEDKNLSVACASVIARYILLKENDRLNKEFGITIPKGAGITVDEVTKEIVKKHGKGILYEISKISFKNTEKVLN